MPDRKLLVTGGAGFIGRHLVRRLVEEGERVVVLDALIPSIHGDDASEPELDGAAFVHGDVREPEAWIEAVGDGVDAIVHLAAETGTGESMYRARRYTDVNVGGTAVLCDLVTQGRVHPERVVVASSRAVYGEGPYRHPDGSVVVPPPRSRAALERGEWELVGTGGEPLDPLPAGPWARPEPSSTYGLTKLSQESLLHLSLPPVGVGSVALRLQNVYGPGQSLRNPYTGILSIFSVQMINGERVRIFEDGLESRDFVFVQDVVEAFVRAIRLPASAEAVTIDVGSGRRTTVSDVAESLRGKLGAPEAGVEVTGEFRVGDIRHALADVSRASRVLDWRPTTGLDQGLDRLLAWIQDSAVPSSGLTSALDEMERVGLLGRSGGPS